MEGVRSNLERQPVGEAANEKLMEKFRISLKEDRKLIIVSVYILYQLPLRHLGSKWDGPSCSFVYVKTANIPSVHLAKL